MTRADQETQAPPRRRLTGGSVRTTMALVLLGGAALVSCRNAGSGSRVEGGVVGDAGVLAAPVLPPPCTEFLRQYRCWLRASGSNGADVDRAVGNARASFESRPLSAESCERAMVFRAEPFASTGCAHAGDDSRELPLAVAIECPPGEHFFVRRDGHVSGCHRDCTVTADCPDGSSCKSEGSAAGGPIDERFCE